MAIGSSTLDASGSHTAPLRRVNVVVNGSLLSNAKSGMTASTASTMLSGKKLDDCQRLPSTVARKNIGDSGALQFLIVDDPQQLKDKARLKYIRQHVMHNYLEKERQKPSSSDIRITKAGNSRKRRKVPTSNKGRVSDLNGASHISSGRSSSLSAVHHTNSQMRSAPEAPTRLDTDENTEMTTINESFPRVTLPCPVKFADDIAPLIRGIAGGFNNSRYLKASSETIPGPASQAFLGGNLQPFACWPTFTDTSLNIEQLKWSCSRKFGTRGISQHWVPALLQAKHAFLSTICISASHDDIMIRGQQTPRERLPYGSTDRMKIRSQVLTMINEALADPKMQTTDATLIAVLHILNSEIMGCDDRIMRIHQNGLHDLVQQRGGLSKLGVDGQLASILTITMYLISALRETTPLAEYTRYNGAKQSVSHDTSRQIPESPLYCRVGGFQTVQRAIPETSPTMRLMQLLHDLTQAFSRQHRLGASAPAKSGTTSPSVVTLRDKIFSLPPADTLTTELPTTHARCQYEALRLSGLAYSHALAAQIPLSTASAQLSRVYNHATATCNLSSDLLHNEDVGTLSWHILIKTALIRTNLSDCWGHMAGVLFFITLIAGACGNPDSTCETNRIKRIASVEEEEARKWLAAVTVRCSIVLSFEYGEVVLATLRRLVGIQKVLAAAESGGSVELLSSSATGTNCLGPREAPSAQFSDYALDFMSGS